MKCLNCLSKDAQRLEIRGWQWLISPMAVPVMCNRCLTSYYVPRLQLVARTLAERTGLV
jgi:hypothetical protein